MAEPVPIGLALLLQSGEKANFSVPHPVSSSAHDHKGLGRDFNYRAIQ